MAKLVEFQVEDDVYFIKKPSPKDETNAQMFAAKVFNEARQKGGILRSKLNDYLVKEGLWSDEKKDLLKTVTERIDHITTNLAKGKKGEYKNLSEGRKAAIELRILRAQQTNLLLEYSRLDQYTLESQAENARFDFLVSVCVLDGNQQKVFSSVDDYYEKANEEWAQKCAQKLSEIINPDINVNWEKDLPENKFLIKYNFVNDNLSLINKKGELVDIDFQPIVKEPEEFEEFDNDLEE